MSAAYPTPTAAAPRTHRGPSRPQVVVDPDRFLRQAEAARSDNPPVQPVPSRTAPVEPETAWRLLDAVRELHGRIARLRRQVSFSQRLHAEVPPMVVRPEAGDPEWAIDLADRQAWWGDLWFETGMLRLDAAEAAARQNEILADPAVTAQVCAAAEEARKSFEEAAGHYRLVQRVHRRIRKMGWSVAVTPARPPVQ